MRMFKKGEKGFTLIELLIVVAILGVLAAIVIPNVGRFIGSGETEAAATELSTIQTAVQSLMVDEGISSFTAMNYITTDNATADMSNFPVYGHATYVLYEGSGGNLVSTPTTANEYYVTVNGTVFQK